MLCAVASLVVALCTAPAPAISAQALKTETARIVTAAGTHDFEVEIADNNETRTQGLMFRKELGHHQGMLFFYDREQNIAMWMRNTYIPLDMIFITGDGTVHRVEENTEPFSERVIASGAQVLAVLEVRAGTAAALGVAPGDKIEHPRFAATKH